MVDLVGGKISIKSGITGAEIIVLVPTNFDPSEINRILNLQKRENKLVRCNWLFDSIEKCRVMDIEPYRVLEEPN